MDPRLPVSSAVGSPEYSSHFVSAFFVLWLGGVSRSVLPTGRGMWLFLDDGSGRGARVCEGKVLSIGDMASESDKCAGIDRGVLMGETSSSPGSVFERLVLWMLSGGKVGDDCEYTDEATRLVGRFWSTEYTDERGRASCSLIGGTARLRNDVSLCVRSMPRKPTMEDPATLEDVQHFRACSLWTQLHVLSPSIGRHRSSRRRR
jgi:hypothetical protein